MSNTSASTMHRRQRKRQQQQKQQDQEGTALHPPGQRETLTEQIVNRLTARH